MVELKLPDSTRRFLEEYNPKGRIFDKFEPKKVDSDVMEDYMDCFKKWDAAQEQTIDLNWAYRFVNDYKPASVNPENIQGFISEVEDFYGELPNRAGLFPFYLINELCPEKEIALKINKPWNYIGFKNSKILEMDGNCGDICGENMTGGEIVVNGDCGLMCGNHMTGGKVIVNGDCGLMCGYCMAGGEIVVKDECGTECGKSMAGGKVIVNGDCGDKCGVDMVGGEIYLNGDYESISRHSGGKIYHKGKLIYKDGEKVSLWKRIF